LSSPGSTERSSNQGLNFDRKRNWLLDARPRGHDSP